MEKEPNIFWRSMVIVFLFTAALWAIHLLQYFGYYDFTSLANTPRTFYGLKGIVFSPFIHGNTDMLLSQHLMNNTAPFMVLLLVLINAYPKVAWPVYLFVHLFSGILVWLFAPANTHHIGISGVIYGLAFFLLASGLLRKNRLSVSIAILIVLVYGSLLAGFFPKPGVSWQSHFFGALSGIIIAFYFRKVDLPPPIEVEVEETQDERHFFDEVPPEQAV